ncbi:DinB family protein [Deinococcus aestuarii]|uniref:DinB family protein n=1 Tax=Deinococcus aestuarii TaxID=2774531 RepID=UPI001C0B69B4|nr:DinB family protein [Deinococcus aestuarii]
MSIKTFLLQQFETEHQVFLMALQEIPEERFSLRSPCGGHSAAWIALHILDWTRLYLPEEQGGGPKAKYAYLGWENEPWTQALQGETAVNEASPQGLVLTALEAALAQSREGYSRLPEQAFAPEYRMQTPFGERALSDLLARQLRHIAYHRGQVVLLQRQWEGTPSSPQPAEHPKNSAGPR